MALVGTVEVQVPETILRDGRCVSIRPVGPEDAPALSDLYAGCSDDSRFFRFHAPKPRLRPTEAAYLAASDGTGRVALVATVTEDGEERVVADARFDIIVPGEVEAALLVRDDFQGAGLGALLLQRLVAIAARLGHRRVVLDILSENRSMLAVARHLGARYAGLAGHSVLYAVDLERER